jgi:hypothetical protein
VLILLKQAEKMGFAVGARRPLESNNIDVLETLPDSSRASIDPLIQIS